ncbi:uncharacterized protein LOC144098220 [Amblyomma americanum]
MTILRETIEEQGVISFQNSAGVSVEGFLELLRAYLGSTIVAHGDSLFVQKRGVSIGSKVAPLLSDLYLAACDKRIQESLKENSVTRIFRYVDDFFVLCRTEDSTDFERLKDSVLETFRKTCPELKFTHELPAKDSLQFLDLRLEFQPGHLCWRYEPRAKKQFLPFSSSHSKTMKRAISSAALFSALKKSCEHQMETSFRRQIERLKNADYPVLMLSSVAESLLRKVKGVQEKKGGHEEGIEREELAVVPYVHGLTHNLMKIGKRHGVRVVCSAPNKAMSMCARVNRQKK